MNNSSQVSKITLVLGFLSILLSIGIWYFTKGETLESVAAAERFGIFVGLWAPSLFALAIYFKE